MNLVELIAAGERIRWHQQDDVLEVHHDNSLVARAGSTDLLLGERALRWETFRAHEGIVDVGTGARLATVRSRSHGPIAVEAGAGRYRITRNGLKFWSRIVTRGIGGKPVATATRFGGRVTIESTDDVPAREMALIHLALVHTWFELGADDVEDAGRPAA